MNAPSGALIAYATAPGRTALDGEGRNGVYTAALLDHVKTAGITIEQMFKRVRVSVEDRTNRAQTPWESTSLRGDFYFLAASTPVARVDAPKPSVASDPLVENRVADIPKGAPAGKLTTITLRDTPNLNFFETDASKMIKNRNFYSKNSNPSGDFANEFVDNGDGTVTDRVTGLMWQKKGSPSEVTFEGASDYAKALNAERFGGYTNWRLPTIEEPCSLLKPIQNKTAQHIDPVFEGSIYACWSCDRFVDVGIPRGCVVSFTRGDVVISSGSASGLLRYERQFVRAVINRFIIVLT